MDKVYAIENVAINMQFKRKKQKTDEQIHSVISIAGVFLFCQCHCVTFPIPFIHFARIMFNCKEWAKNKEKSLALTEIFQMK